MKKGKATMLVSFMALLGCGDALAAMQLDGLERIHFAREPLEGAVDAATQGSAKLLKEILGTLPRIGDGSGKAGCEHDGALCVVFQEHATEGSSLVLREITDVSHPRIASRWWAVYDEGTLSDLWHHDASPTKRPEGKVLPNYSFHGISAMPGKGLRLRLVGELFRPGGFWILKGITLSFRRSGERLVLDSVRSDFTFSQGYDDAFLEVSTETSRRGGYRVAGTKTKDERLLEACAYQSLTLDFPYENPEDEPYDSERRLRWEVMQRKADCILHRSKRVRKSFRGTGTPSFMEDPKAMGIAASADPAVPAGVRRAGKGRGGARR